MIELVKLKKERGEKSYHPWYPTNRALLDAYLLVWSKSFEYNFFPCFCSFSIYYCNSKYPFPSILISFLIFVILFLFSTALHITVPIYLNF